jgi:hypothetical protein
VNLSTNSLDFQPNNQTRARTFITVVQPLLRDSGTQYVRSLHEVATLDGRVALSEFRRQVENQLLEISRAYWTLWLARASFVQKERALQSTREIAGQVAGRTELRCRRHPRLARAGGAAGAGGGDAPRAGRDPQRGGAHPRPRERPALRAREYRRTPAQ